MYFLTWRVIIICLFMQFFSAHQYEGSSCALKDGGTGVCKSLAECSFATEDLKQSNLPKICSFVSVVPIVCCIDCREVEEGPEIRNFLISGYNKVDDRCLEKFYDPVPCNKVNDLFKFLHSRITCYDNPNYFVVSPVIAGGYNAKRGEYPHMALIGYGDTVDSAEWMCGGSVINEHYILTAGHCISSPALGKIKYAALGILKRTDDPRFWQVYDIIKIIAYPEYKPPSKYHDIALLQTRARIRYNYKVLPACLHKGKSLPVTAIATGWGTVGAQKPVAETLQVVSIRKYSDKDCNEAYPKHRHLVKGYNTTTQVCYGDKKLISDTCQGDSGGPLQIKTRGKEKSKCVYKIIGVTSYGRSCGYAGSSGIYTRVAHYVSWIEGIAGKLM